MISQKKPKVIWIEEPVLKILAKEIGNKKELHTFLHQYPIYLITEKTLSKEEKREKELEYLIPFQNYFSSQTPIQEKIKLSKVTNAGQVCYLTDSQIHAYLANHQYGIQSGFLNRGCNDWCQLSSNSVYNEARTAKQLCKTFPNF